MLQPVQSYCTPVSSLDEGETDALIFEGFWTVYPNSKSPKHQNVFGDASSFSSIWEIEREGRKNAGVFSRGTNLRDAWIPVQWQITYASSNDVKIWGYRLPAHTAGQLDLLPERVCSLDANWFRSMKGEGGALIPLCILSSFLFLSLEMSEAKVHSVMNDICPHIYVTKIKIYYFLLNWENRKVINFIRPVLCFCWAGTWTFLV